jgi:hypothetical protein
MTRTRERLNLDETDGFVRSRSVVPAQAAYGLTALR